VSAASHTLSRSPGSCGLTSGERYTASVSAAFEVSPDDPHGVAEAFRRAADGAVVRVVRDGQPVADIVPAGGLSDHERGLMIERRMAARFGAPTLADYRRIYEIEGVAWPGDEVVRRRQVVADPS
jgi:antitoxin (DNA-binding transcriptional repressor) of toxin-antitoxin stability system